MYTKNDMKTTPIGPPSYQEIVPPTRPQFPHDIPIVSLSHSR